MRVLDLFSGIGGFSLGLERAGMKTVAFCEIDPFCRRVLKRHWPDVPIYEDIRTLRGEDIGPVDVICGGYPCQPFSAAGKRRGAEDDRHLWPEMFRLVREIRPAWVIGENVAGHVSMGLDSVLSDLEGAGYACRPFVIPACAVDAPHRRDRVWIVAHSGSQRRQQVAGSAHGHEAAHEGRSTEYLHEPASDGQGRGAGTMADAPQHGRGSGWARRSDPSGSGQREQTFQAMANAAGAGRDTASRAGEAVSEPEAVERSARRRGPLADADKSGPQGHRGLRECAGELPAGPGRESIQGKWLPEPGVGRVAHGVPDRVDRLRALGNAVVPQVVEMIGRAIVEADG